MSENLGVVLHRATKVLKDAGIEDAPREARLLVAHVANISRDRVGLIMHDSVPKGLAERFEVVVSRRAAREPLSHITGTRAFYRHEFRVNSHVLDPRPETETLVEEALKRPFARVLDLGTGSGCILLSLLAAREGTMGVGSDISMEALDIAQQNARDVGVDAQSNFISSNWFSDVDDRFDLIVSNPPYISLEEMPHLAPELGYEPRLALTDEKDGLCAYREISGHAITYLDAHGWLMVEIGQSQGQQVSEMFKTAGLKAIEVIKDLDGRDRVVIGQRPD